MGCPDGSAGGVAGHGASGGETVWVYHYAELRRMESAVERAASTAGSSQCSSASLTPACLREYGSLPHAHLWRWLWLDFSREGPSPATQRLKRKMSGCNLQALADADSDDDAMGRLPSIKEGSLSASVFTLVSSAMGAGCLSLPFMFRQSGILLGLVMLLVGAVLAHLSLVILMCCAKYTDSGSISRLVALTGGGGAGGRAVDVAIAVYGIAAVLCYLIFIGDFFSGIVRSPFLGWHISRETLIVGLAAVVVWPVSLFRSLGALRYVCVLSVGAICLTAAVVACRVPEHWPGAGQADGAGELGTDVWAELEWWNPDPFRALQSFSIALFAFAAHTNAVPVASALKRADSGTIWCVSLYSVGVEFVFYAVMGLAGYLSFRGATKQDFILNYSNDDVVVFFVRCVYGVVVCLGAPINLSPAASSILGLLSPRAQHGGAAGSTHAAVVTLVIAGCVCVAVWSEHIADVIGLCGASLGTLIVLVWPAMIYRRVLYALHPPSLACCVYGLLAGAACVGFAAFAVQAGAQWRSSFEGAAPLEL